MDSTAPNPPPDSPEADPSGSVGLSHETSTAGKPGANAPFRVLFLTPYYRPYLGGIERAIEELSTHLAHSPLIQRIGVLTSKYSFPRVPQPLWADRETLPGDVDVFRLDGFPRRSPPYFSVPLVWFSPFRIRRFLEEFNPNVVHFVGDGWFWAHFWTWFWYRRKALFVFTPSFHSLPLARQWLRPINGIISRTVDRVVALSRRESEEVRRAYWVRPTKLAVVGWGAASPESTDGPSSDSIFTILCVGRLGLHKGQRWLLDVYSVARHRFNRPVRLVLIGRDEDAEAEIRAWLAAQQFNSEVVLAGEVSDQELREWYGRAHLLALFSRYEAFGLVYFEAMAYGVPVLTHDVGANRELLQRGAVVVPTFDAPAATEELVRLVNDDAYRRRLGHEAREYVAEHFTWDRVAQKYLEIYQEVS